MVVFTVPLVGEIDVRDAAAALVTVNELVAVPAELVKVTLQVPGVTPIRLKLRIISIEESVVPVEAPTILEAPDCVKVTVVTPVPVKPVPTISIVCHAPFVALIGEILVITRAAVSVAETDWELSFTVIVCEVKS
jgi:hypothetical protein